MNNLDFWKNLVKKWCYVPDINALENAKAKGTEDISRVKPTDGVQINNFLLDDDYDTEDEDD